MRTKIAIFMLIMVLLCVGCTKKKDYSDSKYASDDINTMIGFGDTIAVNKDEGFYFLNIQSNQSNVEYFDKKTGKQFHVLLSSLDGNEIYKEPIIANGDHIYLGVDQINDETGIHSYLMQLDADGQNAETVIEFKEQLDRMIIHHEYIYYITHDGNGKFKLWQYHRNTKKTVMLREAADITSLRALKDKIYFVSRSEFSNDENDFTLYEYDANSMEYKIRKENIGANYTFYQGNLVYTRDHTYIETDDKDQLLSDQKGLIYADDSYIVIDTVIDSISNEEKRPGLRKLLVYKNREFLHAIEGGYLDESFKFSKGIIDHQLAIAYTSEKDGIILYDLKTKEENIIIFS